MMKNMNSEWVLMGKGKSGWLLALTNDIHGLSQQQLVHVVLSLLPVAQEEVPQLSSTLDY